MQITNQITKNFVRKFRGIWNNEPALKRMTKVEQNAERGYYYKVVFGDFLPFSSEGINVRKAFYESVGLKLDNVGDLNTGYLGVKIDAC